MPKTDSQLTPSKSERTEKFLLCLTSDLKKRIKQEAHRLFGKRKGAESLYVEMVMRNHLHMDVEGVKET